jgi:Family of unknown function (DUF6064)
MQIPFTVEQFFDVFGAYNTAIWPAQIIAYVLGILACALAYRENKMSSRIISGILALFWVWMGAVYHLMHFAKINPAARVFGAFFIVQGLLFFLAGVVSGKLSFRFSPRPLPILGAFFILYAMVIYPVLGSLFGHTYPRVPMFGVAPCPGTIFTFGMMLWATKPVPGFLLAIPLLWALVGLSAAINLRVPQDYGLVVAGVLGAGLVLRQNRKAARVSYYA